MPAPTILNCLSQVSVVPEGWKNHTHSVVSYKKQRYNRQTWNTKNLCGWPSWWVPSLIVLCQRSWWHCWYQGLITLYRRAMSAGMRKLGGHCHSEPQFGSLLNPSLKSWILLSNFHCLCFFWGGSPFCSYHWLNDLHCSQSRLQRIA